MEDIVALTVAKLKADNPLWKDVEEISSLAQLDIKSSGNRTPVLYVFLVNENPKPDVRGSGPYLQTIQATISVVIVDSARNNKSIQFNELRAELRKRLFGWAPSSDLEPYWLGSGRLLSVERGAASWIDNFITEYTQDQNTL